MGSRRITRSSSSNGRSSNGEETNVSSRPGSCSYLSNVRPENRSTLCSVIAQLAEETQPSFETTLKSKAVSEKCNVKFSCVVTGHPTPQVIWYKDDMQLDRYCGLPKYELFRNGQNHSLHIYDCTVDDAAIYQASASNTKGIVSCSGVLEVGEMNEFKIHQRYFGKLKQKAENKRREAEGKENQEPLRTISPDRTQRKRRSTMEAFLSAPSSTEDEGSEQNHQAGTAETEARLQEAAVEKVEEKQVPITNGVVSAVTNGQVISENGNKSGTYIYDSSQKTFTAHQPKTPFVKKKLKISSGAKIAKSDTTGERASEERRAATSAAPAPEEPVQSEGDSEEVMEVENNISSSFVAKNSRNVKEQRQKLQTEVLLAERPSVYAEVTSPSQKEQLIATVPPVTSASYSASGTERRQGAKHEKEAGRKDKQEKSEIQNKSPHFTPTKPQPSAAAPQRHLRTVKRDISEPEHVTVMDVDKKSNTSTGGSLARRDFESVNAPRKSGTVLPQSPCEQAGDQLSVTEPSPCQKNVAVSVSGPALLSEVTQAHTKMNRNDAPVILELPPNHCKRDAQPPQRTPSKRETTTDDIQTRSLQRGPQAAPDKTAQDTRDHTRGSSVSHTALYTDLQKSSLQSPGHAEISRGCNVSPSANQSQVDTAIKTVEGTDIQVDEKVESNVARRLLQSPNEKIVEMETETVALHIIGQTKTEEVREAAGYHTDVVIVDKSVEESEKNVHTLKMVEERSSELQNQKSTRFEPTIPHRIKTQENTNISQDPIKEFQEVSKPETKVISIAELLRAQIKALESTLANSLTTIPLYSEDPTAAKTCTELKNDNLKAELRKSTSDRGTKTSIDVTPLRNIKETLMEVYNQLNMTDQEPSQIASSPPAQKPVVDPGATLETASAEVPPPSLTSKEDLIYRSTSNVSASVTREPVTPLTVTPINAKDEPVPNKDIGILQKSTPEIKLNSQTESGIIETNSSPLSEQNKMGEHNTKTSSLQSLPRCPSESAPDTDTQEINLQLISQDRESSRTSSPACPTPEASPLLKRRNCVSPIPSATPQELASGARRKIVIPKAKPEEASEAASPVENQSPKTEVSTQSSRLSPSPMKLSTSPSLSRRSPLLQPPGEPTSPVERHSPLFSRRKIASETQAPSKQPSEEIQPPKTEEKPAERDKHNPFKAPQVIRKIRGETFADASGHLKLWCQFFNVLGDSTIKWYRNEKGIAQIKRSAGDETQVNLAIVQASSKDSGVYGCTITNEYGTDSTDYLLSSEILAAFSLREDLAVGEEIEMTPLIFSRGVADSGVWGNKFFGRVMMQESRIGDGCSHKVWRAKVIYGLEPVFESGNTCIMKVRNPIAYGGKGESCLLDRNLDFVKQECKIQNLAREYCKIFSAEARVIENFGPCLEVIPVYLIYRPANTVPYATVETDLTGVYQKYSVLDHTGRLDVKTGSDVERKCCALQHWIFEWTNGNLLLTRLEGVDTKITSIGISVKSPGHLGLSVEGNPKVFEQFVSQHQCNYFCGLLGLRSLKVKDSLLTPTKPKGSRSPLLQRKTAAGSSSPQTGRKTAGSPRLPRKTEQDGRNTPTVQKDADAPKVVKME
uniref:alpha-protein kinase 3 n=1 Tax=Semicossyphus pulcher TaxID=241346 RepID=UPI0037E86868